MMWLLVLLSAWAAQAAPSRAGNATPLQMTVWHGSRYAPATRSLLRVDDAFQNASHSSKKTANFNDLPQTVVGYASWYSYASARREGNSGIMANGRRMDDEAFTAASWDYKLGTHIRVVSVASQKGVEVVVTDHGPARRLLRKGVVLDLSQAAFRALAPLSQGIIPIEISEGK